MTEFRRIHKILNNNIIKDFSPKQIRPIIAHSLVETAFILSTKLIQRTTVKSDSCLVVNNGNYNQYGCQFSRVTGQQMFILIRRCSPLLGRGTGLSLSGGIFRFLIFALSCQVFRFANLTFLCCQLLFVQLSPSQFKLYSEK